MTQVIQASAILINELEYRTGLHEVKDRQFFWEWQQDLPELDNWEKQSLDRLKAGYLNLLKEPPLLENAVRMAVLDPLIFTAGLYLAPFYVKAEQSVTIALEDEVNTLLIEGRIDVLVLREQLWLMAIESKRAGIAIEEGLAQLLSYMLGSPNSSKPTFGMITNGGCFLFAKLLKTEPPQYALSDMFVMRRQENELYQVLQILKGLAGNL
jgi:Type I restriction enzyme R protein N terminus (HSDR_N)